MHFSQNTKPDGEAMGSCATIRHVGQTLGGGHALCPGGSGGSGGGGGTIEPRDSAP